MSWQGQVNQPIGVAGIDSNGKIHTLDASQVYNLNASNIATGNLAIARLPGGGVNGANQLVQLDSSGNLPALDASSLTNLSAANITGSIPTANLAKATTSAFGIVQIGSNIDVSAGVISVPAATTSALGVVQPDGVTITIAGGLLVASAASSAVNITGGTTGSIPYQTGAGTTGFISPANNSILVTNGSGTPSLSNTLPAVDGSAITNLTAANVDPASGPLPYQVLPLATSLQAGAVIAGTNISISSGTISVATAGATFGSAGSLGVAAGDGVTITVNSSGIMTASAASNVGGGAAGDLLYQSGANTTSFITSANGVLVGNGGTPAYTTTPTLTGTNFSGIPNGATTATDVNTASAIVARDVNGDFSAGTITANLTGTASGNQVLKPLAVAANFATWDGAGQTVDSGLSLNTSTSLVGAANTNIPSTLAIKTYVDNAVTGGLNIIGSWDASTNTPTLTAGIGVQGNAYICNVAGTQTLPSGSPVAYYVGDVLFYSAGGIWDVIPAGNTVVSVNGQQGVVSLGLADMDDTTITGPAAAQLLVYNGTDGKWENVGVTGVIAITEAGVTSFANTITIAQGGTSATTQQAAINNLAGAVTSGLYLRGDGTNVSMSAIQAADVPTLNQNTTGNAATATTATNLSGTSVNAIPYQSASATTGYISSANDAVLVTNGSGTPSFATTLPAVNGSALTDLNASNISSGTVPIANLPTGTALAKGILQVGTNISVAAGTISVATAGVASGSAGTIGLMAGDGVTIEVDGSGIASAVAATNTTAGIVTPDNSTLKVVAGKLTATTATTSQLGVVKPDGVTITVTGGVISASASALPITSTAVDYTVLATDGIVLVTAPNTVITLPLAADGVVGKVYTVKAANVAGCTVVPQAGEFLDGISSAESYLLDNYFSLNTFTDGTQWYIYG